jgi:tetratricopeptide (TPR) repeat protein
MSRLSIAQVTAVGAFALLAGAMAAYPAAAQTQAAETQSQAAFGAVLKDPGNLEKNLAYAKALIAEGDIEGAVAVFERLVLIFPDRADLHLSLGKLYTRLGSDAAAAQAYDAAIAAPIGTPEIREQARALRKRELAKTATSHFAGSLYAGMQYQTNANAGPDAARIRADGTLIKRPGHSHPDDDISGVVGFNLAHSYDFGLQNGLALESKLSGFGQAFGEFDEFDTAHVNGQVGLGFAPMPGAFSTFRIQPRVNFEGASTNGEWLEGGGGAGIGMKAGISDSLMLEASYDFTYRNYDHVHQLGATQEYTGFEHDGVVSLTWIPWSGGTLIGAVGGRGVDARKDFLDYAGVQTSLGFYQSYGSPVAFLQQDWLLGLSAGYESRWYKSPDDSVDPDRSRHDSVWQFDASNTIPITEAWSLTQQVEYLLLDSNLRNYSYDNVTLAMTARWRF